MNTITAIAILDRWHKELQYDLARAVEFKSAAKLDAADILLKEGAFHPRTKQAEAQLKAAEQRCSLLTERSEALAFALDRMVKQ